MHKHDYTAVPLASLEFDKLGRIRLFIFNKILNKLPTWGQ